MKNKAIEQVILPNDPGQQQKLKIMINEVLSSLQRTDQEKETKKEIVDEIHKQFTVPKKILNRLVNSLHKHNFSDIQKEHDLLEMLHDTIVKSSKHS